MTCGILFTQVKGRRKRPSLAGPSGQDGRLVDEVLRIEHPMHIVQQDFHVDAL